MVYNIYKLDSKPTINDKEVKEMKALLRKPYRLYGINCDYSRKKARLIRKGLIRDPYADLPF